MGGASLLGSALGRLSRRAACAQPRRGAGDATD
jgi:hypothetical protein